MLGLLAWIIQGIFWAVFYYRVQLGFFLWLHDGNSKPGILLDENNQWAMFFALSDLVA